ncbi:hypothetical protein ABK040_006106 [Willaertia magna]
MSNEDKQQQGDSNNASNDCIIDNIDDFIIPQTPKCQFKVEEWYNKCKDLTFPTKFISITIGQMKSIIHFYELFHKYIRNLLTEKELLNDNENNNDKSENDKINDKSENLFIKRKLELMDWLIEKSKINLEKNNIIVKENIFEEFFNKIQHQNIFTKNDVNNLQNLMELIGNEMESLQQEFNEFNEIKKTISFFTRLSTRSPKDASLEFKDLFLEKLKFYLKDCKLDESISVIRTFSNTLKVYNNLQAILLFIFSERVYYDLFRTLLFLDEKDKKNENFIVKDQQIVIRLFKEIKFPEYEFRVFVKYFKKENLHKITGITQYFKSCYLKELKNIKEIFIKKIEDLKNKICNCLQTTEDFVMDITIDFDFDKLNQENISNQNINNQNLKQENIELLERELKIWLIEINPFCKQTAACLFDWKKEEDCNVLSGKWYSTNDITSSTTTSSDNTSLKEEKEEKVLKEVQFLFNKQEKTTEEIRNDLSQEVRNLLIQLESTTTVTTTTNKESSHQSKCYLQ